MNIKQIFPVAVVASLALLASQLLASASLAVYSYSGTTTTTGGGKSLSTTQTGTMVIDLDTMAATYVGQFSTGSGKTLKNWWVSTPLDNTINTQVVGPNGASYTLIAIVENPGTRYSGSIAHFQSAVGLNSLVTIRSKNGSETALLPKTLASPGFVLTVDSNYDYLAQSTGNYSFNSAATLASNNAGKDFSTLVSELENAYKSKNYTAYLPNIFPFYASVLSTLAGSGSASFADGVGTSARFNGPFGVAVDGGENIYVSDQINQRIRKITSTGIVTTLAGSGTEGFAVGQGAAASFSNPAGVALDGSGNIYVADSGNNKIRKITPAGVVSTLAGSNQGYADGGGGSAKFNCPVGIALDRNGNAYIAEYSNHRIRKISPSGIVTTLAGSGNWNYADGQGIAASFRCPYGVAVDGSGNVYVADSGNCRIRKITQAGNVTTLAGSGISGCADGQGTAASFSYPTGVAVDGSGNVYVADSGNNKIRKITPAGVVSTLAGSGNATYADGQGTAASFNYPIGVAVGSSGDVYISDSGNNRIRKITISQ